MNMGSNNPKQEIIVSLTSFPAAISYAVRAVNSILSGSVLPDRIVIYLTFSDFGEKGIPEEMLKLAENNPIFEIRNHEPDLRSYQKLIPALNDFPEAVIVTVDDDIDYHPHMLRDLLRWHEEYPEAIVAHRVRMVSIGKPYRKWHKLKRRDFIFKKIRMEYRFMQTGVGGVLYPPHSLKEDMLEPALFRQIAPTCDDFWFWAAAVANGRKVLPVPFAPYNRPCELHKPDKISLKTVNYVSGEDRNYATFLTILEKYPIVRQRIEE